jgi:hypothetical protein
MFPIHRAVASDGGYVYRPPFPMRVQRARGAYMRVTVAPTNVNCNTALFYPSFSRDRTPPVMTNTVMLPYQNLDVPQVFYYINDLALDEDDELLLQLGT